MVFLVAARLLGLLEILDRDVDSRVVDDSVADESCAKNKRVVGGGVGRAGYNGELGCGSFDGEAGDCIRSQREGQVRSRGPGRISVRSGEKNLKVTGRAASVRVEREGGRPTGQVVEFNITDPNPSHCS